MQSIITKFIPPTNCRGARIKATCPRGSITVYYPSALSGVDCHAFAAQALVGKFVAEDKVTYGTPPAENPWARPMQYLELSDGYVFGWPEPVNT